MPFTDRFKTRRQETKTSTPLAARPKQPPLPRASLLGIPAELRIAIFQHVFPNARHIVLFNGSRNKTLDVEYQRDPETGHAVPTGKRPASEGLLTVCRQVREEALGPCFNHLLFGITAGMFQYMLQTPYDQSIRPVPHGKIPDSILRRMKHLLIITEVRGDSWERYGFRVADLRYLQAMTSLRSIRIMILNSHACSHEAPDNGGCLTPIRGIIESVPATSAAWFASEERRPVSATDQLGAAIVRRVSANQSGSLLEFPYGSVHWYVGNTEDRGLMSGSTVDHSSCEKPRCQEDRRCVNSTLATLAPKPPNSMSARVAKFLSEKGGNWKKGDVNFS